MPDTDSVLENPEVKAAIAKLQGKYDTQIAGLTKQVETLTRQRDDFTSAVDSVPDDEPDTSPKTKSVLATLKAKADAAKAASAESARQAESRELAKHKAATDLFIKYGHRGVKLQDLLAMSDEAEMREHIIGVLEAATTTATASGRVTSGGTDLANKAKVGKADFYEEAKDLFEEGHREGRTVFQTQKFD